MACSGRWRLCRLCPTLDKELFLHKSDWQEKGEGHQQRLCDKFLAQSIDAFTDSEIIELLLTFGGPALRMQGGGLGGTGQIRKPARSALRRPVRVAADQGHWPQEHLCPPFHPGGGPAPPPPAHYRQALCPLLPRGGRLPDSFHARVATRSALRDLPRRCPRDHRFDGGDREGTVTSNTVYPRELVKAALARNASALILAHNHPSGNLNPSRQDEK